MHGIILKEIVKMFKEDKPDAGNLIFIRDTYSFGKFNQLIKEARLKKPRRFHAKSIVRVESDRIPPLITRQYVDRGKVIVIEQEGVFKLFFSDGSFIYYANWMEKGFERNTITGVFVAEESTWAKFIQIANKADQKRSKPPARGIWRIEIDQYGNIYYEKELKLPDNKLVIPEAEGLINDMRVFFKHISKYTKNDNPGIQKALLSGKPGTGKSSFCFHIARVFQAKVPVIITTTFREMQRHIIKTAHYRQPSIVVLEDADSSMKDVTSQMLNFMDGVDQPLNPKGTFVIMTTNHPDNIQKRLKRMGRINIFKTFGPLKGADALACAENYFEWNAHAFSALRKNGGEYFLLDVFDNLTGAQIREISIATHRFMVGSGIGELTLDVISRVKEDMLRSYEDARREYDDDLTIGRRRVGFS